MKENASERIKVGDLVRRKHKLRMGLVYKVAEKAVINGRLVCYNKIYFIDQETGKKDWHYELTLDGLMNFEVLKKTS